MFKEAAETVGVCESDIVLGFDENPPLAMSCRVYILIKDMEIQYLENCGDRWEKWMYREK